jgi:hypothetical protein
MVGDHPIVGSQGFFDLLSILLDAPDQKPGFRR